VVAEGYMTQQEWDTVSEKAMQLFRFGQEQALKNGGLILVDTKYEFGKDRRGNILLVDEIHTPDSSRYWLHSTYESRLSNGLPPESIDKDVLRTWYKTKCDPYKQAILPRAPDDLRVLLSSRYIELFEKITGTSFADVLKSTTTTRIPTTRVPRPLKGGDSSSVYADLVATLSDLGYLDRTKKVVLILGSEVDLVWSERITLKLEEFGLSYDQYVASAHKSPRKVLDILSAYEPEIGTSQSSCGNTDKRKGNKKKTNKIVYVTVAGRSNALSGFVAANSSFPTLACPPFTDKIDMLVNIHSTLQMPSDVPVLTILDPSNAAIAVKRILDL